MPYFLVQLKSEAGHEDVAERQILYHGSLGARAQHTVRLYNPSQEEEFDGRAHVLGCVFTGKKDVNLCILSNPAGQP